MKWQAYAARPHPDHGMTAPSYAPIAGAIGDTPEAAIAAIPAAVASFGLEPWRVARMQQEAKAFKVKDK